MSPTPGSIHRRPRSDSGAARLWQWARTRRGPWTTLEAAEAAELTARRTRAIVAALGDAGLLDRIKESELEGDAGQQAAEWEMSAAGRALAAPPVLIVDGQVGIITGVRAAANGDGTEKLRKAIARSKLSIRAAAKQLQVNETTLRRMLRGEPPIAGDDPIIARARAM